MKCNFEKIVNAGINNRLIVLTILLGSFISNFTFGQYYGLKFSSYEVSLDQRSGLDLSPDGPLSIKDELDLSFYLKIQAEQESYFGYIFRLMLGENNIDLIHSIIDDHPNNFELILGDKTSKISFNVPLSRLSTEWTKFRFKFDFKEKKIYSYINDTILIDDMSGSMANDGFRLMFGAHSFDRFSSTDLPRMTLRDVEVRTKNELKYSWPLDQTQGDEVLSIPSGYNGVVKNPDWILYRHNNWNNIIELSTKGIVKSAFNPLLNDFYIVSNDTLFVFNVSDNSLQKIEYKTPFCILGTSETIYDTVSRQLISYSLDNNFKSVFNFEDSCWSASLPSTVPLTVYWHHNRYIGSDGAIYTFGGYGEFMYKNAVFVCKPGTESFDTVKYKGDFHPRYLAGSGYNPNDSLLYIIGGYGSKSGKQIVNPDYYYDILGYSIKDRSFKSIFEFSDINSAFCFGNSVIIDQSNNLYALQFPKHLFTNSLQLIKIPLDEPEIFKLGTLIDFSFNDVQSNADLFYSSVSNKLIAVTSYFTEGRSNIELYTIAFPPEAIPKNMLAVKKTENNARIGLIVILVILIILITAIITRRSVFKKKNLLSNIAGGEESQNTTSLTEISENPYKTKANSIILFGGFQVIDKNGTDITGSFSPLLKKLFLYILLSSLRNNKGVSSTILSETFWFDKSTDSARNNRAVNIVKLRTLIENVGVASISKDTGYWTFDFEQSSLYIDYFEYLKIVKRKTELNKDNIIELLSIIDSGQFLLNTNADWLDIYKSEVSNEIIDTLVDYINRSDDDHEFTLHLTNCMFLFDIASEEAMSMQCKLLVKLGKHSLAKQSYAKFVKEYKQLYDEDYALSFTQIIDEK